MIGVVEPGARAAAHATKNRRVGVIATKATVESDAYTKAIRHIDAGITVFSTATPRFVDIAEQGIKMAEGPIEDFTSLASKVYIRPAFQEIAQDYLDPLRRCEIDTLVLGCTHFPLLKASTRQSGAMSHLSRPLTKPGASTYGYLPAAGELASPDAVAHYEFNTTGTDIEGFERFGGRAFGHAIGQVNHVDLP